MLIVLLFALTGIWSTACSKTDCRTERFSLKGSMYRHILMSSDGSEYSDPALKHAAAPVPQCRFQVDGAAFRP